MPSITLKYGTTSRTFNSARSIKGFIPTDGQVQFPDLKPVLLDGSRIKKQSAFRRCFTVDLGVLTDADDLSFIGNFLNSETQYLTHTYYGGFTGPVSEIDSITLGGSGATAYMDVAMSPNHNLSDGHTVTIYNNTSISPSINQAWTVYDVVSASTIRIIIGAGYSSGIGILGTARRTPGYFQESDLQVVDMHTEYQSEWIDGVEAGRRIVLQLEESTARTTWP